MIRGNISNFVADHLRCVGVGIAAVILGLCRWRFALVESHPREQHCQEGRHYPDEIERDTIEPAYTARLHALR